MRILLVSVVTSKNQIISGSLDWKPVVGVCVSLSPLNGVRRVFCGTQSRSLSQILSVGIFFNVCNSSLCIIEKKMFKKFLLCFSVSWMWNWKLVWKRSSNSSNVSIFLSKVGVVAVRDFGILEILLMFLLRLAELPLLANCWRATQFCSASIIPGVFSLRKCGWPVERAFFHFLEEVPGEQHGVSPWTLVTLWEVSSRSKSAELRT